MTAASHAGRGEAGRRELRGTCRLQLYGGVDLGAARELVPYLRSLGISHLYLSPVLRSRSTSDHGYDGVDFTRIDPRLGTESDLVALADALHAAEMGLILDIVPNHMAASAENAAWMDVLANGRASEYASWFDVDWDAAGGRVVLPVLGERLPAAIASGALRLAHEEGRYVVCYHEHRFPLTERTAAALDAAHGDAAAEHMRDTAGLSAILEQQRWRLVYWKRAARDINYRRFFTISDLVTLRQEDPRVFEATHATVLEWVRRGLVDGLRIDHVDGLLDPTAYLRRLRDAAPGVTVHVEKILAPGEALPADWPVDGTTGYDFLAEAEDLFVDAKGWRRLERDWRRSTRRDIDGHGVAVRAKRRILEGHLTADVRRVVRLMEAAVRAIGAEAAPPAALTRAIVETIAALPVYRTYIRPGEREAAPAERAHLEGALDAAAAAGAEPGPLGLLRALLLDPSSTTDARRTFVARFQQLCVPAAAKGVEDTAFYAWVPLASRNEVGAEPAQPPDDAVAAFHGAALRRAERHPQAMLAVSTHDTKRSADVRARLDVLSELAGTWSAAVGRWRRWNHEARTRVQGRLVPDAATELLFYQTLVGAWPLDDLEPGAHPPADAFVERIDAYVGKAAREAKLNTSWIEPDEAFEEALRTFVRRTLRPDSDAAPFLAAVRTFAADVAPAGLWNSLSRTLLQYTAPGVPDLYRGDELWTFDLVDPDNRRPVDVVRRAELMEALPLDAAGLLESARDGRVKMHVIRRALKLRERWPDVFRVGEYAPLAAHGSMAAHVVAFARSHGGRSAIVAVPRLVHALAGPGVPPVGGVWADTMIPAPPAAGPVRCALTGRECAVEHAGGRAWLRARDVFEPLPVALLYGEGA